MKGIPSCGFLRVSIRSVAIGFVAISFAAGTRGHAQTTTAEELSRRVEQMQNRLDVAQRQLEEDHVVLEELQRQLAALRAAPAASESNAEEVGRLQQAVSDLREQQAVQQSEIAVHEQTKVETQSKYSLRVGGLALFNAFSNDGAVNSVDLPVLALARTGSVAHGSLGATVRQTLLNLDATGPDVWGAHTYASLQVDFFGGLSAADYTATGGLLRLRTADVQLAWPKISARAGLSPLLISPSTPTSYASIAEPALSWSGLLWTWLPQISVERPFSVGGTRHLTLAAAAADVADAGASYNSVSRPATAAESSRVPGVETHVAYSWGGDGRGTNSRDTYSRDTEGGSRIGAGGYWSPHDYGSNGSFDAWAALLDWKLALPRHLELSGQVYKGAGLGGLSAGTFKDYIAYLYTEPDGTQSARYRALRDQGGWTQLKFHPVSWLEFNGAAGMDNSTAAQLHEVMLDATDPYAVLARNQSVFGNIIFRPRSALLFSAEYRKLRSIPLTGPLNSAQIYTLSAGFQF